MIEYVCFECDFDDPCILTTEFEEVNEPVFCPYDKEVKPVWVKDEDEGE